jgi:hypothetical protein
MESWTRTVSSAGFDLHRARRRQSRGSLQGNGLGTQPCADFAKAYAANPSVAEDIYFIWTQGFMSGMNASAPAASPNSNDLGDGSLESHKARIRAYCDAHPLAQYAQAVQDLYLTFPSRNDQN